MRLARLLVGRWRVHGYVYAQYGVYLYYGSRVAQPKRVRAFIDLAVRRGCTTRQDLVLAL